VVGIFADQDMGNQRFGGQSALDQPGWRGRLDHRALARPAAVPGPAGDDDPELRRDHVEPFGDVLADPVQRAATAGASLILGLGHDLFARQMLGQSATVATTLPGARRFECRVGLLRLRLARGQCLLDVFEGQLQLIGMGRLLRSSPEQGPLQLFDDRPQVLVLPGKLGRRRAFGQQQSFERRHVVRQRGGFGDIRRRAHGWSGSQRRCLVIH
jgi:hypothetical protein